MCLRAISAWVTEDKIKAPGHRLDEDTLQVMSYLTVPTCFLKENAVFSDGRVRVKISSFLIIKTDF